MDGQDPARRWRHRHLGDSSPLANGVLDKSGNITVDENAWLDLTFDAKPGYKLFTVFKDSDNWTFLLDSNDHFQFGPVGNSHTITATFPLISPTGSFEFTFPVDDPLVTAIALLTGNYTGTMPGPFSERGYDFDVAMDEDGKLEVMGTAEDIEPEPGGDPLGGAGQCKTVDDQPMAQAKVKFEGTVDGVPSSAKASGESAMEVKDLGGTPGIEGTHTYNASFGGVKYSDKDRPFQAKLDPASVDNIAKDWSLRLDISEQVNPKNGNLSYVADAQLTLQNGEMIVFPQKTVKYSAKKGYKISLSKGTNVSVVPRRS